MTITVGDKFPEITLKRLGAEGMEDFKIAEFLADKKVVLFAVPGAFTPTCAQKHLPGYISQADAIKAKGVDAILCLAVNDPFVMKHWGEVAGADGKVMMIPDGNGDLVQALGLTLDGSGAGLGQRSQRFMMVIDHGQVSELQVEPAAGALELSGADVCLARL
ncbi:MAG: peroxiredoxin [Alphaproteobacteria bacterium]|nr:peroxiredoxin [Alphaproteobacteria bacterium]MCB9985490.1 peroxiredoxin [Micavibrio sp.]HPQ50202.1 peroxiredoxin [Alphaproteobacteria bacterium]